MHRKYNIELVITPSQKILKIVLVNYSRQLIIFHNKVNLNEIVLKKLFFVCLRQLKKKSTFNFSYIYI